MRVSCLSSRLAASELASAALQGAGVLLGSSGTFLLSVCLDESTATGEVAAGSFALDTADKAATAGVAACEKRQASPD